MIQNRPKSRCDSRFPTGSPTPTRHGAGQDQRQGPVQPDPGHRAPACSSPRPWRRRPASSSTRRAGRTFDTFEIEGGLKVEKAKARVEDLFQLDGMNGMGLAGVELHGVIGYNVLARFRIQYDFTADKLVVRAAADFDPPPLVPLGGKGERAASQSMGPMMKMLAALMGIKPNFDIVPRGFLGIEFDEKDGVVVKKVLRRQPGREGRASRPATPSRR